MAFPAKPSISTSFTAEEQALGDGTFPGQEIDVALDALRASIDEIIDFLPSIARSDGALKNGIVTSDSLATALTIGFDAPEPWATGTDYTTYSTVFSGYGFYLCLAAHTSGTFATDLAAGRWQLLADLTPPAGALIASNNLSDVADAATARSNLGAQVAVTGGASSITTSNLTASRALVSDGSGKVGVSTVTATQLGTIGAGTNLASLAGLTLAANKGLYSTAANTVALFDLTAAGRALLDDADAAAQRTTLGLGTAAVADSGDIGTTNGTSVASTSGTAVDFTGIPSTAKRIRIMFGGVSTSGTAAVGVQIGDSGGFLNSGYLAAAGDVVGAVAANFTTFFGTQSGGGSAHVRHGMIELNNITGNQWACTGILALSGAGQVFVCGGTATLSGTLDRVRITSASGADTFDAGNINISWEG